MACQIIDRILKNIVEIEADDRDVELSQTYALTSRERDILFLLSQGYSRKEMARLTSLSPYTIADYVKNLYAKLGVKNRSHATRLAMTMGLQPPRL